jgi:hypothetical protein
VALPALPEALAASLTEQAEAGLTFGTLDGYCSGIAHRHHQEGLPDPAADVVADSAGSWESGRDARPTRSLLPGPPISSRLSTRTPPLVSNLSEWPEATTR